MSPDPFKALVADLADERGHHARPSDYRPGDHLRADREPDERSGTDELEAITPPRHTELPQQEMVVIACPHGMDDDRDCRRCAAIVAGTDGDHYWYRPGERRGRLTLVRAYYDPTRNESTRRRGEFRCVCGETTHTALSHWAAGRVKSCGCLRLDATRTHGCSSEPWYLSWVAMNWRCRSHPNYVDVEVCERWKDPLKFAEDMAASHFPGAHLGRVADEGDYEPGNARWITNSQNAKEMRHVRRLPDGRVAVDVARQNGIKDSTFRRRVQAGWSLERAATTPTEARKPYSEWGASA